MAELTKEDIEVAKMILDFQKLLHTDMVVAFPEGIRPYHLSALTGSFMEMFLQLCPKERRKDMWATIKMGIEARLSDGRL